MSAWEYRSKAAALLAENQFLEAVEIADELAGAGYILRADEQIVAEEITDHDAAALWSESEYDSYCKCGKWLEYDEYEWPDHLGDVLDKWLSEAGRADR